MKITAHRNLHGRRRLEELAVRAGPHRRRACTASAKATLNGFIRTTEAAVRELEHCRSAQDPRRITALAKRMLDSVSLDGGHIHRTAIAAIEVACWDILGKSLGVPIHQLLGGRVRDSVLGYANGWYRTERTPEAFVAAAEAVVAKGFRALKLDPFGTAQGFIERARSSTSPTTSSRRCARRCRKHLRILIDVHARFTEAEAIRAARRLAPLGPLLVGGAHHARAAGDACTPSRRACPIRVATGEMYDTVGQFFTLAEGGGVNIFQPEPMSLGGIANTLAVANLALAHGSYIAPHQSGGPVATAVCLQLAAAVPNFLIQEHFDAFNEPWTRDLVTWHPTIDPANGHLSLPDGPGLGIDLNVEVAPAHPYDPKAYLNIYRGGLGEAHRQRARTRHLMRPPSPAVREKGVAGSTPVPRPGASPCLGAPRGPPP